MIIFRIKEIRKRKRVSLKLLSRKTGISRSYLFDLENNRKTNPSLHLLLNISNILNVNVKELFCTTFDLDNLKEEMYRRIDKYGLNSSEVLEISQLIDLLVNIDLNNKKRELNP